MRESLDVRLDGLEDWSSMPALYKAIEHVGGVRRLHSGFNADSLADLSSMGEDKNY
jgi:hypothetical protein